ncbi:MAG: nucleotidyltransferase domain-containing protein [Promethearchaeota archaeon]
MSNLISTTKIREDLTPLEGYWVVMYGSYIDDNYIPYRSDIDVAVISKIKNPHTNLNLWREILGKTSSLYDVRIFELLPLFIQIRIINSYRIIFGDALEISEYFYKFRKIWKDMVFRYENNQFKGIEEKIRAIKTRKKHS